MSCSTRTIRDLLAQLLEQLHHALGFGDAESRHRLVEQQKFRLACQRNRQLDLATLAMAEPGHQDIGTMDETDAIERGMRGIAQALLLACIGEEAERGAGMRLRRERDIVGGGEIEQQRGDLERTCQAQRAAAIGRQIGDVAPRQRDAAGMRLQMPCELADQRGLAGAVRADDGVQLACRNVERDVVRRNDAAEAAHQPVDAEQRLSHD
ncbi:hypothetical protein ACVWXL_007937 [Bradyrhizobium sp. GM22.5]